MLDIFGGDRIGRRLHRRAAAAMPKLSETEKQALEAGDAGWDAELFTGRPDWRALLARPRPDFTEVERAFFDGPCARLCGMIDDWDMTWRRGDLPPEVWRFLREERFFGMIIPEAHGGLGFSSFAQSEVVRRISTRSIAAGVTVMVPNSLGPGELLLQYGTEAQRDHWLPRLADGREIPSFALTSEEAGSDAASMVDEGLVVREGRETLGLRITWRKRYISLAPRATVLGLAFRLRDPDGLLGGAEDRGITLALIPTDAEGVTVGRRHIPCMQPFLNGPTQGAGVFVPLDAIIGGREGIGKGWTMLMGALNAGRGISLPSLAAASTTFSARTTGAYARVREQFGIPVAKFEGVGRRLGRLAGLAYQLDAARRLTCAELDAGGRPAVISAIMKAHTTYRMREAVNDAMDVHGGKAIIDGPSNYLGNINRAVPIGITVEGANILTRHLIVFGQGVIRLRPYLLDEMLALEAEDEEEGRARFLAGLRGHAGHAIRTLGRATLGGCTGGRLSHAPAEAGDLATHYRQLSRFSAALVAATDLALLTMGGALKRKELISARLGDILSELYLLSAVLKRFEEDGRPEADRPLVDWCMETGVERMEARLAATFRNLPNRFVGVLGRLLLLPLGRVKRGPDDALILRCAAILTEPSEARDRLTAGVNCGSGEDGIERLERAFRLVTETDAARARMRKSGAAGIDEAEAQGVITTEEADRLRERNDAVAAAVAVDDFAPEEVSRDFHSARDARGAEGDAA